MANRYWVGGTGNWSDDDNHWAATSGGSPADGNLPTSSDDVFIDANSGFGSGGTISLDGENTCRDITCSSGHTFTIDESSGIMNCYGSVIFESGLTLGDTSRKFLFQQTTGNYTITTNGASLKSYFAFGWGGGDATFTLLDDFSTEGSFVLGGGTFDANDHNVTANDFYFYADFGYTPTVIMGSGTWEATGNDDSSYPWYIDEYSSEIVTIVPETSTIKFTDSSSFTKTFRGLGKTYNNIWLSGEGDGEFNIYGANTFNEFKVDAGKKLKFAEETTTTVTTFTAIGTSGNLITINTWYDIPEGRVLTAEIASGGSGYNTGDFIYVQSGDNGCLLYVISVDGSGAITNFQIMDGGSGYSIENNVLTSEGSGTGFTVNILSIHINTAQHTLSKSSGIVECDYLDISNSNATGGATWYAGSHSADTTNNDGWLFEDAPAPAPEVPTAQKNNNFNFLSLNRL